MLVGSILTLFGIGLLLSTILAIASKVFHVEENPLIEQVMDALPGVNCGGCGYPGCEGYAIAVAQDPSIPANLCTAGTDQTSINVGKITGKIVEAAEPLLSFRRCDKVAGNVSQKYIYEGIASCTSVSMLMDGSDACKWSCLGYGDCVTACPFDAMAIENGLVHINPNKCTGCNVCVKVCPRDSLELIPMRARVAIFCATKDKLKSVTDVCDVGCINCSKCIKACPASAITNPHGRIEIDQKTCLAYGSECKEACVTSCPRKILRLTCPPEDSPVSEDSPVVEASQEENTANV